MTKASKEKLYLGATKAAIKRFVTGKHFSRQELFTYKSLVYNSKGPAWQYQVLNTLNDLGIIIKSREEGYPMARYKSKGKSSKDALQEYLNDQSHLIALLWPKSNPQTEIDFEDIPSVGEFDGISELSPTEKEEASKLISGKAIDFFQESTNESNDDIERNAQLIRALNISNDLSQTSGLDIYELAKRYQVTTRTIRRDLEALEAAGFSLAAEQGAGSSKKRWVINSNKTNNNNIENATLKLSYFIMENLVYMRDKLDLMENNISELTIKVDKLLNDLYE